MWGQLVHMHWHYTQHSGPCMPVHIVRHLVEPVGQAARTEAVAEGGQSRQGFARHKVEFLVPEYPRNMQAWVVGSPRIQSVHIHRKHTYYYDSQAELANQVGIEAALADRLVSLRILEELISMALVR